MPVAPVAEPSPGVGAALVSPRRVLAALSVVGVTSWALESAAGLGPSAVVVAVAALGSAAAVRYGHAVRRVTLITFVIVAVTGLGWIELINTAQYGTLALTGAPPGAVVRGHLQAERCRHLGAVDGSGRRVLDNPQDTVGIRRVRSRPGRAPLLCHERAALRRRGPGTLRGL